MNGHFSQKIITKFTQIKLLSSFQAEYILFNRIIAENYCMQIVSGKWKIDDDKSEKNWADSMEIGAA